MRTLILIATVAFAISGCDTPPPGDNAESVDANLTAEENAAMNADMNASDNMPADPADTATDTVGTPSYSGGDRDTEEMNSDDISNDQ
jgi:hypothetical protein